MKKENIFEKNRDNSAGKTTLRTIRSLIGSTKDIRTLPTAKKLRTDAENGEIVLVAVKTLSDCIMEVYSNGFAVYQKPHHQTVLRMEYVGKARYEEYEPQTGHSRYYAYDLEDEDWAVAVMLTGEDRMEQRHEEKCRKTLVNIYGTECRDNGYQETGFPDLDAGVDILADIIAGQFMEEMLSLLTDRQREMTEMYYIGQMTETMIAERLGVRRTTVETTLDRAILKLRKSLEKE